VIQEHVNSGDMQTHVSTPTKPMHLELVPRRAAAAQPGNWPGSRGNIHINATRSVGFSKYIVHKRHTSIGYASCHT
jgi:hypothetical protein